MMKRFTFVTHSTSNRNFSAVNPLVEICSLKNICYLQRPWVYLIYKVTLHIYIVLFPVNASIYRVVQISPRNLDCSTNKNVNS